MLPCIRGLSDDYQGRGNRDYYDDDYNVGNHDHFDANNGDESVKDGLSLSHTRGSMIIIMIHPSSG